MCIGFGYFYVGCFFFQNYSFLQCPLFKWWKGKMEKTSGAREIGRVGKVKLKSYSKILINLF
jgi:hypothetical protein